MKTASYLKTFFLALIMFCSLGSTANAQKSDADAIKVAFITDKLDLSADEATAFWPVYNEFQEKRRVLRKEKKGTEGIDVEVKQKILDLEKDYVTKFKEVLPAIKVDQLFQAEKEWKQKLIDQMNKRKKKQE